MKVEPSMSSMKVEPSTMKVEHSAMKTKHCECPLKRSEHFSVGVLEQS